MERTGSLELHFGMCKYCRCSRCVDCGTGRGLHIKISAFAQMPGNKLNGGFPLADTTGLGDTLTASHTVNFQAQASLANRSHI